MSTPPPSHPGYPGYPAHPQAPGPYPYQQMPGQYVPVATCQLCGAAPAAPVTVRGHQGMVVIMKFLKREGLFCRTCALASFRDMQAETMVLGWWGPLSLVITPFTLLGNLSALSRIRRIPEPVTAGFRPPLDPGRPVFRRPAGILALIPVGLLGAAVFAFTALLVIGLVAGPGGPGAQERLTVGSCVRNDGTWTDEDLETVDCGSSDAQFRVNAPVDATCPSGDYLADLEYSEHGDTTLCLHPLKA